MIEGKTEKDFVGNIAIHEDHLPHSRRTCSTVSSKVVELQLTTDAFSVHVSVGLELPLDGSGFAIDGGEAPLWTEACPLLWDSKCSPWGESALVAMILELLDS